MNPADSESNPLHEQTTARPVAGRKFSQGRFTLQRLLKRGGMGAVWLAHDGRLDKLVALKFLPPVLADNPAALAQLRRETAHSLRLTHPHIVRIHDLHESPGEEPFIVMEFVDGQSLTELRAVRPDGVLSWETLAPLVKHLCAALEYAHAEKVIHRDLKPSNLLLDHQGRLKLADFGIAVVISETMTRVTGESVGTSGTVAYMSPQQVNGELPKITDDLYSLGATLFELLTGTPPFHSGEIVHQVLHKPPPTVEARLAELKIINPVPPPVSQTILACLDKDSARRPQSAREAAERLQLGEVTAGFVLPPPPRSRRRMTAAFAVAAVIMAGVLWWTFRPDEFSPPESSPDSSVKPRAITLGKKPGVPPASVLFAESFETVDESGLPPGWFCAAYGRDLDGRGPAVEVVREAGGAFLRCRMVSSRDPAFVVRWVGVPPQVPLRVRVRVRVSPLKIEPQFTGAGAVVRCVWLLEDGRKIKAGGADQVLLRRDTAGWEQQEFVVPPPSSRAVRVVLEAGLVGAVGECDMDDLVVEVDSPAPPPSPASPAARVRDLFADDFEKSPVSAVIPNWQSDKASQSPASRGKLVIASIDGNKFLRISTTRESPAPIQVFRIVPRDKNTLVEISARARATALFTNNVRAAHVMKCIFLDSSGNALSEFAPPGGTVRLEAGLPWARVTCRIVPPGNTGAIRLHLAVPPGTGTLDFDNVRVTALE